MPAALPLSGMVDVRHAGFRVSQRLPVRERVMRPIITLTMNPAVDVTTSVDELVPCTKLRCARSRYDPGGGGVNVSRTIRELGGESTALVLALAGGPSLVDACCRGVAAAAAAVTTPATELLPARRCRPALCRGGGRPGGLTSGGAGPVITLARTGSVGARRVLQPCLRRKIKCLSTQVNARGGPYR